MNGLPIANCQLALVDEYRQAVASRPFEALWSRWQSVSDLAVRGKSLTCR